MKAYATAVTLILINCATSTSAQTNIPKHEAGLRLSALAYQGDLSPSIIGSYKTPGIGFGVFVTKNLNTSFAVRANFDYGRFSGNDAVYSKPDWRQQRNFNFSATAMELSSHLVYNVKSSYRNYGLAPYVFGGAGISFLNIQRDYSGFNANYPDWQSWVATGLAEDIQHTLPKLAMIFPVGGGFRHQVSQQLTLFGEASYRFMFTDYLDGFSKSADPKDKDHYSNISVGMVYRFGNNAINCPKY